MKTTVVLPDALFRDAKAAAARQGVSLREFFTQAVREQLHRSEGGGAITKPWTKAFGGLAEIHRETKRIERIIAAEFERPDWEEWR